MIPDSVDFCLRTQLSLVTKTETGYTIIATFKYGFTLNPDGSYEMSQPLSTDLATESHQNVVENLPLE